MTRNSIFSTFFEMGANAQLFETLALSIAVAIVFPWALWFLSTRVNKSKAGLIEKWGQQLGGEGPLVEFEAKQTQQFVSPQPSRWNPRIGAPVLVLVLFIFQLIPLIPLVSLWDRAVRGSAEKNRLVFLVSINLLLLFIECLYFNRKRDTEVVRSVAPWIPKEWGEK